MYIYLPMGSWIEISWMLFGGKTFSREIFFGESLARIPRLGRCWSWSFPLHPRDNRSRIASLSTPSRHLGDFLGRSSKLTIFAAICWQFQSSMFKQDRTCKLPMFFFFFFGGGFWHTKPLKIRHHLKQTGLAWHNFRSDLAHPGCQDGGDSFVFFSEIIGCLGIFGERFGWPGTLMPSRDMVLTKVWSRCLVELQLLFSSLRFYFPLFFVLVWFIWPIKSWGKNRINLEELGFLTLLSRSISRIPPIPISFESSSHILPGWTYGSPSQTWHIFFQLTSHGGELRKMKALNQVMFDYQEPGRRVMGSCCKCQYVCQFSHEFQPIVRPSHIKNRLQKRVTKKWFIQNDSVSKWGTTKWLWHDSILIAIAFQGQEF